MKRIFNPITKLRLKRAASRRAPMPVSHRPRRKRGEAKGPNPATAAGKLLYGLYEAAMFHAHQARRSITMERMLADERRHGRRTSSGAWKPAGADSREARRRRGQKLQQHPSVVARFANHPTRADIEAAVATAEKRSLGQKAGDALRKVAGETKAQRDARIKRERRASAKSA